MYEIGCLQNVYGFAIECDQTKRWLHRERTQIIVIIKQL